jgi:hypothetical protein
MKGGDLLLHEFPHLHRPFTSQSYKVDPAAQIADVKLCFGLGDLPGYEFLTVYVKY